MSIQKSVTNTNTGIVQIVVLEARNLPAMDVGNTSDPYVILKFDKEEKKSEVKKRTLVPVWLQEFSFTTKSQADLEICIFDQDGLSKDDFMCSTTIPARTLFSAKETTSWYKLFLKGKKKAAGEVKIRTQWTRGRNPTVLPLLCTGKLFQLNNPKFNPPESSVQIIENYLMIRQNAGDGSKLCLNISGAKVIPKGKNKFKIETPIDGDPEPTLEALSESDYLQFTEYLLDVAAGKFTTETRRISGELSLKVIEATHLPNLSNLGRVCDPYVLVIVGQDQQRTATIPDTLNPKWNHKFKFIVTTSNTEAIIIVMDGDSFSTHTSIGRCRLKLDDFQNQKNVTKTVLLEIFGTGIKHSKTAITLEISYTVKPYERTDKSLFGEDLKTILERDKLPIPKFVSQVIHILKDNYLELEGIFRISGSQNEISELRASIDEGEEVDLKAVSPHNLTGLLKLFFRELPEPLLTFAFHDKFMKIAENLSNESEEQVVKEISSLVQQLPKENLQLLKELSFFLLEISQKSKVNKMTTDNLGIVFGPNLLRSRAGDAMSSMLKSPALFSVIIKNANHLF